jgi:hypothetical protein
LYLFVVSPAGRSGEAERFSKLLCRPSGEETEVVAFGEAWLRVGQGSLGGGVVEPSGPLPPLGSGDEAAFCGLLLRF